MTTVSENAGAGSWQREPGKTIHLTQPVGAELIAHIAGLSATKEKEQPS